MRQVKPIKLPVLILADIIIIALSLYLSLYLRFLGQVPAIFVQNLNSILIPAIFINLFTFYMLGLYQKKWFHSGFLGLTKLAIIVLLGLLLTYLYSLYSGLLPRSFYLIAFIMLLIFIGGSHIFSKLLTFNSIDHQKRLKTVYSNSVKSTVLIVFKFVFDTFNRMFAFIIEHKELTLIVFVSFMMRLFLAGWNSYWLDELYSVYERGIAFDSSIEVLKYHQERGSSMPLYEFILFHWMTLFGHTEVVTRTLSSIYVALSTLFLYLFTTKIFSRRIAISSTLLYSFSYMAIYYALEARYYGQMLFLCVLSSYLLLVYLESIANHFTWEKIFINKYFVLLSIVNVAVMLTFVFNYLFLVAQGVFVLSYFIYLNRSVSYFKNVVYVIVMYVSQLLLMIIFWGPFIFRSLIKSLTSGSVNGIYNSDGVASSYSFLPFKNPLSILMDNVVSPNLVLYNIVYFILFVLLCFLFIRYVRHCYKRNTKNTIVTRKFYFFYIVIWFLLPSILVYIIFTLGQLDKLQPRYLIFCTPPLMVILALSIEQGIIMLSNILKRLFNVQLLRHYIRYAIVYALIATIVLVLPGGYIAATNRKVDWRGIAEQIVQQVHLDPEHSYVVVETTWRGPRTLDYYFKRFSGQVRVSARITHTTERGLAEEDNFLTAPIIFRDLSLSEIEEHDYLIVAFTHHRVSNFPKVLDMLSEEYELLFSVLDDAGRGYLVYNPKHVDEYAEYKEESIQGGLKFDGVNDYIDLEFSPGFNTNDNFTFELWVKLLDDINDSTALFGSGENQAGAYGFHAFYQENLSFGIRTDDGKARVDFANFCLNTWYHLAGVYDGSEKKVSFFVNGKYIGTDTLGVSAISLLGSLGFNLPVTIRGPLAETGHTNCIKYEARLWDKARTQEEIMTDMLIKLNGNEDNLIGYWPLDEGSGDIAHDLTANENHGVIHGATWYIFE